MFDTPITTNDQSIDRVLATGMPVLFVFLEGAAPEALENALNRAARENAGKLLVAKIQIRENPSSKQRYQIVSPPALVAMQAGKVQAKVESISPNDIESFAAYLVGKGPKPVTQPSAGYSPSRPSNGRGETPRTETAQGRPRTVTDESFEREVLRSQHPVLVDFWAPWCGPCRMTEPILEKLAREAAGRLVIAKVNVDENPALAQRYAVQSIPTMMVVNNGQVVDRWMGALPEQGLRARAARYL